ncbi:Hypothetical predicted protein [Octopus vulgaris]|uniref:Uncharacterized protein n=1 Tax=Octopus vulgaris TaxID=6645 RepID=A0AA36AZY2_OCTVU|nr:Hypothetical predicted protein [Octopus vulgaris]
MEGYLNKESYVQRLINYDKKRDTESPSSKHTIRFREISVSLSAAEFTKITKTRLETKRSCLMKTTETPEER